MSLKSLTGASLATIVLALPAQAETTYPLTLANCSVETTVSAEPEGTVAVGHPQPAPMRMGRTLTDRVEG